MGAGFLVVLGTGLGVVFEPGLGVVFETGFAVVFGLSAPGFPWFDELTLVVGFGVEDLTVVDLIEVGLAAGFLVVDLLLAAAGLLFVLTGLACDLLTVGLVVVFTVGLFVVFMDTDEARACKFNFCQFSQFVI